MDPKPRRQSGIDTNELERVIGLLFERQAQESRQTSTLDAGETWNSDLDNQLSLLIEGRLAELPEDQQAVLLRLLIQNPEIGEAVVAARHALELEEQHVRDTADAQPRLMLTSHAKHQTTRGMFLRWGVPLAMAACLTFGLFVWRMADPPVTSAFPGSMSSMGMPGTPAQVDYWDQLDEERKQELIQNSRLRDYALVLCAAATLVLAIPVSLKLMMTFLQRQDQNQRHEKQEDAKG